MGRVKLSEIDKSYLNNFLKYEEKEINKDWIIKVSSINMITLLLTAYLEGYKSFLAITFYTLCILILIFLIYFFKRAKHNKENLYLYFGIYTTLLSVSFGGLSYALLKKEFVNDSFWIILFLIVLSLIVAIITYCIYIRKIKNNCFESKKIIQTVSTGAITCGIFVARQLELSFYIAFGSCCGLVAIASASNIHFLIQYYCYYLLKEDN